jgi:hypothetical protein
LQWLDGSTTWIALKDLKEGLPVQLAEYAVENGIHQEPALAWWVPYTLKKRARIIKKTKSKYWTTTHKYGFRIPKTVEEARDIDSANGNTLWWDAIVKEMKNIIPGFEASNKSEEELVKEGFQKIDCHFIFDIKIGEEFRRKARYVAGGHKTNTPATLTYSSVVSRDSVRIALLLAALNDLDMLACDIQNAYLNADCREKIFSIAGPEFGANEGRIMIVRKALYGLKSSGAAFRAMLANTLREMGFQSTLADPDVWIRPMTHPTRKNADGTSFDYYEMVLVYVDDVLAQSHAPMDIMDEIRETFKLKNDAAEPPSNYLGAQLKKIKNPREGRPGEAWCISAEKYVSAAVTNVEERLEKEGRRLMEHSTPLPTNYAPELEDSPELRAFGVQYYQELIGVLRWAVEIGRCDILLETSLMSAHLAAPRQGHLDMVLHIFGYLKKNKKRKLLMDPTDPGVDPDRFIKCDWSDFYPDAAEKMPDNAPEARGTPVGIHCFVDASHANDKSTRRSQTGILIFVNSAPIIWYSKRQNTVETSTFGSEFTAMRIAVEQVEALRYKLRMFGVPLDGPANVYCDNEAVTKNTTKPESTLNKKHHAVAYHKAREAVAAGIIRVAWEDTTTNLADLFTKLLEFTKRNSLFDLFMY